MAWHLYRLGRLAFRRRRIVVGLWVALLVLGGFGASALSGKTSDEFTLPGIESMDAFDLIKERTPDAAPDGATARVVFQAPEGETLTSPENEQFVLDTLETLETPSTLSVVNPFEGGSLSEDERTGYATVSYTVSSIELEEADQDALKAASQPAEEGVLVAIGGDALQEIPHSGTAELIGIGIALLVLVITFGSLLAAGMPILTALIGVAVGIGGIQIATGFVTLGSATPTLATMIGLAVGIDYALFIASRYRHEVAIGRSHEEAAGRAVGTAGSAVIFAGITVIIALLGLSVVNISFLTQMGVAAAFTVAVAVLIAITLLPALFGFAGEKIIKNRLPFARPRHSDTKAPGVTMGRRWADLVTHRRVLTIVAGVVVALVVGGPISSMNLALPDGGTARQGTDTRISYDLIAENFGPGANGPLMVVADTANAADPRAAVDATYELVSQLDRGVEAVVSPIPPADDPDAVASFEEGLEANQYALITVVPTTGPSNADTQDLVHDLRDVVRDVEADTGAEVLVTGATAVGIDISENLADAFPVYLAVVVGLAFLLLLVIFRSILVPLKAVLGFLVTICISLGATVAVFQWGWFSALSGVDTPAPVLFMLPLLLTGILFGLAMDYELFLVSRMREEYVHGSPAKQAVVIGFQHGARVVTAAALIMIGVFTGFALGDDPMIKSIGFALAVGILADAFLVRMTLVPAVLALLGDKAWWLPKWLDRILPNLDIEGESLAKKLGQER